MKTRLLVTAIGAATLAASGCAFQGGPSYAPSSYSTYNAHGAGAAAYRSQQRVSPPTRFEFDLSYEDFVDGDIIEGGAVVAGNTYNNVSYRDAYDAGYRASVGVVSEFVPNTAVMAKGFYRHADSRGPVTVATNGGNVDASFSDYQSYGAELGVRQYFGSPRSGIRPFLGAAIGAAFVEEINLEGPGVVGAVNEGGWVPTVSATGGLELPVSSRTSLAFETGLRYEGYQDRAAFGALLGADDSSLSVPVTLRGSFRF